MYRENYIKIPDCKDRYLYRLASRNLVLGVYNESTKGFVGIRKKFGYEYLFTEYHYDAPAYATAQPIEELFKIPDELVVNDELGTCDRVTGRMVAFDKPTKDDGRGWYFVDTGEQLDLNVSCPCGKTNTALFEYLKPYDIQYIEKEKEEAEQFAAELKKRREQKNVK